MFKKNIKPILMAGALALATTVSPVLAEEIPNVNSNGTITVTKNFQYAYGVNFDDNVTVTINAAPAQFDELSVPQDKVPSLSFGSKNGVQNVNSMTFNSSQNTGADAITSGTVTLTDSVQIILPVYTHAGEYDYTITEEVSDSTKTNTKAGTVTEYQLRVYVINGTSGPVINYVTAAKVVPETVETSELEKVENILFENEYKETASLTISKDVSGNLADQTKDFTFKITLTAPEISNATNHIEKDTDEAVTGTKVNGYIGSEKIEFEYGVEKTVLLHHGESLVFSSLPAGTTYTVIEDEESDGYVPSYQVTKGTVQGTKVDGKDGTDLRVTEVLTDEGATVAYTNTYSDNNNPITGVIVNNMPYIALLGASGAGLVVLAASKKRSKK